MDEQNVDLDFARPAGPIHYTQEHWDEAHRVEALTAVDQHEAMMEASRRFAANPLAQDILGEGSHAAQLEPDPEAFKALREGREPATSEAPTPDSLDALRPPPVPGTPADPFASPSASPVEAPGQAPHSLSSETARQALEKPTSLESSLAQIQLTGKRQERFVILGDPNIEQRFYDKLAEKGLLQYRGSVPVIFANRTRALELLKEAASEVPGAQAHHAVSLTMDRDSDGGLRGLTTGLANAFGRRHAVDVVVVGSPDVIDSKRQELGELLGQMDRANFFKRDAAAGAPPLADGKLVLAAEGPVRLEGAQHLSDLVSMVKAKVSDYRRQEMDKEQTRRAFRNEKDDLAIAGKAAKDASVVPVVAGDGPIASPVNAFADTVTKELHTALATPGQLAQTNEKNQTTAELVLRRLNYLKDPATPEFVTLPAPARHQALVELSALAVQVDAKAFGAGAQKALDMHPAGERSLRVKLADWVATERAQDPQFGATAQTLTAALVKSGVVTEAQATQMMAQLSGATPVHSPEAHTGAAGANTPPVRNEPPAATPVADAAKLSPSATQEASASPRAVPVNAYAEKLVQALDTAVSTPGELAKLNDRSQTGAAALLGRFKHLKDPAQPELATVPDAARQTALVQLSAVAAKVDGKEFDVATTKALHAHRTGEPSMREKLTQWVAAEHARDPQFEKTAQTLTAHLVQSGVLTEAQGEHVSAQLRLTPQAGASAGGQPGTSTPSDHAAVAGPTTLRDRLAHMAQSGPQALTPDRASSLLSELDARRTKPLSAVDAGTGSGPTETLTRVAALLRTVESGRFGAALAAQAGDLKGSLAEWQRQNESRYAGDSGLQGTSVAVDARQAQEKDSAWHPDVTAPREAPSGTATPTSAAPSEGASVSPVASSSATPGPLADRFTSTPPEAPSAARIEAAERDVHTLAKAMANPAGSFTNRDKTWNAPALQRVANLVANLDVEAVSRLSPQERTTAAAYAAWLSDNATQGKVPGFDSTAGKALAQDVTTKATALVEGATGLGEMRPDVERGIVKGDRMVTAMAQRAHTHERVSAATEHSAPARLDAHHSATSVAKDLVHAVYKAPELSEAYAKYLLKSASTLTPDNLKTLDADTQSKTAVALNFLANQVHSGAMGDYASLSPAVQRHTANALKVADTLNTALAQDPAMSTALTKAYLELNSVLDKGAAATPTQDSASSAGSQANSKPGKAADTGVALER